MGQGNLQVAHVFQRLIDVGIIFSSDYLIVKLCKYTFLTSYPGLKFLELGIGTINVTVKINKQHLLKV